MSRDLPPAGAEDALLTSTGLWRAAFERFERLAGLDAAGCARELEVLAQAEPQVYPQVLTLLRAHRDVREGEFLKTLGPDRPALAPLLPDLAAGLLLGDYRLERPLGAGGMGEVWLARRADGLFETPVALKLLHPHLATSSVRERFVREGRILGELSHPNVAHLLDAGATPDGRLYLAIEYIDGQRIDQWCDTRNLDLAARLRLFIAVCGAVSHAHARLVVHRDLKPSNILISADGTVKLLDFGIAKLIETTGLGLALTELTQLGGRVLTPEYAAPEQVLGAPVTVATDVYALGVLLYLLLTGRRPYGLDAKTASQIEREVIETEPPPPSRAADGKALRKRLAGDLDTITSKALKKAPADRYVSVLALAEDLERHLDNRPVLAQPDSLAYRTGKFLRRHRFPVAAAGALAITLVAGLAGVLHQAQEAARAEQRAREQAERVKRSKDFFVGVFSSANPFKRQGEGAQTLNEALDQAVARVDTELADDPRFQGDLLSDLGAIRLGQGDFDDAKTMFERALAQHEKTLPPDDPVLAETLLNRGTVGSYLGDFQEGLPYLRRALAIRERHAETDPEALIYARLVFAQVLGQAGEPEAALQTMLSSLDAARRRPGPREDNLAHVLMTAGFLYHKGGQTPQAVPYMREALAVYERNYGPEAAYLLPPLELLSYAARDDNDLAGQLAYAERQVRVARRNFPEANPAKAGATINLARAYQGLGRYAEAEALFRDTATQWEALQQQDVHAAYAGLGHLALERDAAAESLSLHERALAACLAMPAPQQPASCFGYARGRARTLLSLGRRDEANSVIDPAVTGLRTVGPTAAALLSQGLAAQAEIRSARGDHEAAVGAGRESLDIALQAQPRAYAVSAARQQLALHLARWGGPEHLDEALRLMADAPPPAPPLAEFLPDYRMVQAELALLDGRRAAALEAGREAVQLLESRRPARERDYRLASALLQRAGAAQE